MLFFTDMYGISNAGLNAYCGHGVLSKPVTADVGSLWSCMFCRVQTSHNSCRVRVRLYVLSCPHQSPLISDHSEAVRFVLSRPVTTHVVSFWGCTFCLVHTSHHSCRVMSEAVRFVLSTPVNHSCRVILRAVHFVLSRPVIIHIGSMAVRFTAIVKQCSWRDSSSQMSPLFVFVVVVIVSQGLVKAERTRIPLQSATYHDRLLYIDMNINWFKQEFIPGQNKGTTKTWWALQRVCGL